MSYKATFTVDGVFDCTWGLTVMPGKIEGGNKIKVGDLIHVYEHPFSSKREHGRIKTMCFGGTGSYVIEGITEIEKGYWVGVVDKDEAKPYTFTMQPVQEDILLQEQKVTIQYRKEEMGLRKQLVTFVIILFGIPMIIGDNLVHCYKEVVQDIKDLFEGLRDV
jgi:hypothetical protein